MRQWNSQMIGQFLCFPRGFPCSTFTRVTMLISSLITKTRTRTTVTWINRFETWQKVRGIANELENIPVNDLTVRILQSFFAEIRKSYGTEHEPECLRVMLSAMDCYLREKGWEYSILKDKMFGSCRKVLNGKAIELREKGMEKCKNKSGPLTYIWWIRTVMEVKSAGKQQPKVL